MVLWTLKNSAGPALLGRIFILLHWRSLWNLGLFFIYFLSNRLFFQNILFVNLAYESTVDEGSNYCRAKGEGWIIQSVSKWNKQLGYQKTQWSNEHILQNQIWSLKISLPTYSKIAKVTRVRTYRVPYQQFFTQKFDNKNHSCANGTTHCTTI